MKMSRAAYRYAKAALQFAGADPAPLAKDMEQVGLLLKAHNDVALFLENPVLPAERKKLTLLKLMPQYTPAFAQLLEVLAENNRLAVLGGVAQQYGQLYAAKQGELKATVVTAVRLTKALEDQVMQKAKTITTKKIQLVNIVDSTIIGGFILTLGDLQYDASVVHQLKGIKTALMTKQ